MKIIFLIFTLTLTTCQTVVGVGKVKAYSELAKKLGRVTKLERVIVTGKVTEKQGLRIREKPTTSSKQLGIIPVDGAVRITSLEGPEETIYGITSRWYELVYEGQAGWAFGGFISYEKTKVTKYVEKKTDGEEIDKNFGLKLRKKAGRSSETLGHIAFGEKLEVLDDTTGLQETIYDIPGRWLKVRYGEKVGWVFGGLVEYEKEKKEE
ncbi:MAG: SH3 domain-containing protein, partial [Bacteroidetes bacterium]|nr:SH3 domain-containing protein [Bacteroidota bacterium]